VGRIIFSSCRLPTPWSWMLENLIVAHLVKTFSVFVGPKSYYPIYKKMLTFVPYPEIYLQQILPYLLLTSLIILNLSPKILSKYLYPKSLKNIYVYYYGFHTCSKVSDKQHKILSCLVNPNIFFINLFYNSKKPCSSWGWGNKCLAHRMKHVATVLNIFKFL